VRIVPVKHQLNQYIKSSLARRDRINHKINSQKNRGVPAAV
jgi:hypothetical protein